MISFFTSFGTVKVIKSRETLSPKTMATEDLKRIDIASFDKALKSVWIGKYLDKSNKGKWKMCFDAELENVGSQAILGATLRSKTPRSLLTILAPSQGAHNLAE